MNAVYFSSLPPRLPRRLLVTLKLGEMPEHIPSLREVRQEAVVMARRIDGGAIDRLLSHHGGAARCARLHSARITRFDRPGVCGSRRFDDMEQLSGVARILRVEVRDDTSVPTLVHALSQLHHVERVLPDLLCALPFDGPAHGAPTRKPLTTAEVDPAAARRPRNLIRLPQALALEAGDPSVVVGLADTGVTHQHAELQHRLRRGFDTVDLESTALGGLVLVGENHGHDLDPDDEVGHGSGCAGIIRAMGNAIPLGGAGQCGLTPARVLGAALQNGKRVGVGALADIDAGMKRLIDLGVRVINMSFGTPESAIAAGDPRPHEEVVRYALNRGVILVAASGNSGKEERYFPAALDGVIAVGAVDDARIPCSFSTRGEHVALCAPGREIWTCGREGYAQVTGTSFASPFVAAACALLLSRANRRAQPLDGVAARELLTASAQPFAPDRDGRGCGAGVLDVAAALRLLDSREDADGPLPPDNP